MTLTSYFKLKGISAGYFHKKFTSNVVDDGKIDESLNNLEQDDPKLIQAIRTKYLVWPSVEEYPNDKQDWEKYLAGKPLFQLFIR